MLEPPPTATITSAPDFLHAATPSVTFLIVGFGLISSYSEYSIPASVNTFSTFAVTPASTNGLSVTKNTFLNFPFLISSASTSLALFPKYDVSFKTNLIAILYSSFVILI